LSPHTSGSHSVTCSVGQTNSSSTGSSGGPSSHRSYQMHWFSTQPQLVLGVFGKNSQLVITPDSAEQTSLLQPPAKQSASEVQSLLEDVPSKRSTLGSDSLTVAHLSPSSTKHLGSSLIKQASSVHAARPVSEHVHVLHPSKYPSGQVVQLTIGSSRSGSGLSGSGSS